MKKTLLFCLAFASFAHGVAQTSPLPDKDMFWEKSRHQQTAAWLLVGGGTALLISGLVVTGRNVKQQIGNAIGNIFNPTNPQRASGSNTAGYILVGAGGLCLAASIRFFILSGKNRRSALMITDFRSPTNVLHSVAHGQAAGIQLSFVQTMF